VEEFKGWTAKVAQELKRAGCPMLFRADRKLVELEASAGAPPACAPTVEVAVDRILIDGFEIVVTDLESIGQGLGDRLKALGDNFKALHPKAPAPAKLVLVIDRNAPWSFIVRVAAAISAAGYRRVGLVFAPTGLQLPPAPPSSSIDKPIEDIRWADPATRGSGLAYLSEKIMAPCPALGKVFSAVGTAPPEEKADLLLRGTLEVIDQCPCALELAALQSLFWALVWIEPRIVVEIELAKPGSRSPGKTVQADGANLWETVYGQVLKAAGPKRRTALRLAVEKRSR
jgi:hypothetical protein